jgi:hypothetical protein
MNQNNETPQDRRARVARAVEEAVNMPRLGIGKGKQAIQTERRRRAEYFLARLTEQGSVPAWINSTFVAGIFHVPKAEAGAMLDKARNER